MPHDHIDTKIGEYLIPGETEIIDRYIKTFSKHFKKHYEGKSGVTQRAIHAKSHGVLQAQLEIIDHGDEELQFGIFKSPKTYDALVRISNGDGPAGKDTDKVASIGFAIKVRGVTNEKYFPEQTEDSQDFLFLNQPKYITSDVRAYESLMRAIDGGIFDKIHALVHNWRGLLYRRKASPKDNPLNTFYWGVAPFKLGNTAVKYLIRPKDVQPKTPNDMADGLKPLVKKYIENKHATYEVYVQKRILDGKELKKMPIEDYGITWDETHSVPVHVGTLHMPKQKMDNQLDSKGEHMVFSPWNTTKDFRPLGSLNRARRVVYAFSVQARLKLNKTKNPLA